MPRRDFDDDDDFPRRPSRRSRYEDDDDDYDDEPRRRKSSSSSSNMPLILGLVGGGFLLLLALAVGGVFAFRARPAAPPQQQFAGAPQPIAPQPVFVPPGVPVGVIPDEVALECTITNLRIEQAGLGGRQALTFDYEFPGGRPFGGDRFIAVVNEPGKPPLYVNLVGFMNARDKVLINRVGIGNFERSTTVYIGKGFGNPKRISNLLTLQ